MGVDTLLVPLSVILTELYLNIHFSVMAALICIKMVLGAFFQLGNIANRFLLVFSRLDAEIRSIFPGVHMNPIFRLDYTDMASDRLSGVRFIAASEAAFSLQARRKASIAASFTVCTVACG